MVKKRSNSWESIPEEIGSRVLNALMSVRFLVTFPLGMFVIGGLGVYIPYIVSDDENKIFWESQALFTYSSAILGALLIDFFLTKEKGSDLSFLALLLGMISFGLTCYGFYLTNSGYQLLTLLGAIAAVLLYFFVNVNEEKYDSERDTVSTSAGYQEVDPKNIKNSETE